MIGQTLTQNDRELLRMILTSPNPAETVAVFLDIFQRRAAGESMESIAVGYGLDWEEVQSNGSA